MRSSSVAVVPVSWFRLSGIQCRAPRVRVVSLCGVYSEKCEGAFALYGLSLCLIGYVDVQVCHVISAVIQVIVNKLNDRHLGIIAAEDGADENADWSPL